MVHFAVMYILLTLFKFQHQASFGLLSCDFQTAGEQNGAAEAAISFHILQAPKFKTEKQPAQRKPGCNYSMCPLPKIILGHFPSLDLSFYLSSLLSQFSSLLPSSLPPFPSPFVSILPAVSLRINMADGEVSLLLKNLQLVFPFLPWTGELLAALLLPQRGQPHAPLLPESSAQMPTPPQADAHPKFEHTHTLFQASPPKQAQIKLFGSKRMEAGKVTHKCTHSVLQNNSNLFDVVVAFSRPNIWANLRECVSYEHPSILPAECLKWNIRPFHGG